MPRRNHPGGGTVVVPAAVQGRDNGNLYNWTNSLGSVLGEGPKGAPMTLTSAFELLSRWSGNPRVRVHDHRQIVVYLPDNGTCTTWIGRDAMQNPFTDAEMAALEKIADEYPGVAS